MTVLLHKRGTGVPTADAFNSVGEILIDTSTGMAYTLTDAGTVVALAGSGGGGGGLTKAEADELYAPKTGSPYYTKTNHPFSNLMIMDYTWALTKSMYGRSWHPGTKDQGVDPNGMIGSSADPLYRIYAKNFYKEGTPLMAASDMVETFTTLQKAIADETTVEGIKTALTNSLGGLIEKFEAMNDDG